jgi:hypothetical protein
MPRRFPARDDRGGISYEDDILEHFSRRFFMKETLKKATKDTKTPSQLIDVRIAELGDWRGEILARIRKLINGADPEVSEEWKWRGTPVWSHNGMICTGETYKDHVKITFAKGASLNDPDGLFTQDGTVRRAIDFYEGDKLNEKSLKALILAAVALNTAGRKTSRK